MKAFIFLLGLCLFALAEDHFSIIGDLPSECSDGWRITGYYVPEEKDFHGKKVDLNVGGTVYQFKEDFISSVKMQGSGYSEYGWVLACCWQKRSGIIGACGRELTKLAAVARDASLYKCGQCLKINTDVLRSYTFSALDTGGAIKGKHLDVFCGGDKSLANRVTSNNANVCTC